MEGTVATDSKIIETLMTDHDEDADIHDEGGGVQTVPQVRPRAGAKVRASLPTTPIDPQDERYKDYPQAAKMARLVAKLNDTAYMVYGDDLWDFMARGSPLGAESISIIDLRERKTEYWASFFPVSSPGKIQTFRHALHMPLKDAPGGTNGDQFEQVFTAWTKDDKNKSAVQKMLGADKVIIHCVVGEDRSPDAVVRYHEMVKAQKLKPSKQGQQVCLLYRGTRFGIFPQINQVRMAKYAMYEKPPATGETPDKADERKKRLEAGKKAYLRFVSHVLDEW